MPRGVSFINPRMEEKEAGPEDSDLRPGDGNLYTKQWEPLELRLGEKAFWFLLNDFLSYFLGIDGIFPARNLSFDSLQP